VIEALHFSRQLEAARMLRRYRHLIAEDSQGHRNNASPGSGKEESGVDAH
jgi:hypothetical protein